MASFQPENDIDRRLLNFAAHTRRIPRRALRCPIYGTVNIVLNERVTSAIFNKIAPGSSSIAQYTAKVILAERLSTQKGAS